MILKRKEQKETKKEQNALTWLEYNLYLTKLINEFRIFRGALEETTENLIEVYNDSKVLETLEIMEKKINKTKNSKELIFKSHFIELRVKFVEDKLREYEISYREGMENTLNKMSYKIYDQNIKIITTSILACDWLNYSPKNPRFINGELERKIYRLKDDDIITEEEYIKGKLKFRTFYQEESPVVEYVEQKNNTQGLSRKKFDSLYKDALAITGKKER